MIFVEHYTGWVWTGALMLLVGTYLVRLCVVWGLDCLTAIENALFEYRHSRAKRKLSAKSRVPSPEEEQWRLPRNE